MRLLRAFVYGSIALMLAAGWVFLYWQSGTIDLAAGNAARAALGDLRAIDARWNDQLIGARLSTAAVPLRPVTHDAAYAWLELQALHLAHPELGRALAGVRSAFERKSALLRRIAAGQAPDDEVWRVPTRSSLDQLARVLEQAFDEALAQTERYRARLLYYSAFLLVLLGWLAYELARAAAGLERRVDERTRELSSTLDKLKESETMLVQSEKMSALGQMVAGLAHELNTPLAYVKASLEAVQGRAADAGRLVRETRWLLELVEAEPADEAALTAQFGTVRALLADKRLETLEGQIKDGLYGIAQMGELVSSLKDFSRLERGAVVLYDLHQGIEATLRIANTQIGKRAVKRAFGNIPQVNCAPAQINQVLLNLLVNAAQATCEADGVIEVATRLADPDCVAIEVSDNGPGIPPEVAPKIFDPFFTTKEAGKGTGLGLAICYRIVEAHGGRLEVQSTPGAGARFTILLPVVPPAA